VKEVLLYVAQAVASVIHCPDLQQTEDRSAASVIIQENILPGDDIEILEGPPTMVELSGEYILELKEEKRKVCPYEV